MTSHVSSRLAAVVAVGLLVSGFAFAQGTPTVVVDKSELVFDLTTGVTAQDFTVSLSTGQAAVFDVSTTSSAITAFALDPPTTVLPNRIRVSLNPAGLSVGIVGQVVISGTGFLTKQVPVRVSNGTNPGNSSFFATPGAVSFTQTAGVTPAPVVVTLSSNTGTIPTYTPSITYTGGGTNWLSIQPAPSIPSASPTLTVTPITAAVGVGTHTATINLVASGFPTLSIPVTLTVTESSAGLPLPATPTSLTFSGNQTQTQLVTVTTPNVTVPYTISLSSNLVGIVQVPSVGATNGAFQVTVVNPQFVIPTNGSITLTPTFGSGYTAVTIPVSINPQGIGNLAVNPTALSFTAVAGSFADVPRQPISVTSTDFTQRQFQVTTTTSSPVNFLTVDTNFGTTPANINVGINATGLTQPGLHFGTVAITPLSGGGATTYVQVTLNLIQGITVTPDQTSVALTAPAGTTVVQRNVVLSSSVPNIAFTTTTATTSGGSGWLTVAATSSTTLPSTITIAANPANLAPGTYSGSVAVTAQGVTVATIPVTLTVTPAATLQLSPTSLTFNYETTASNLPVSQTIQVNTNNGVGVPWTAAVTSGSWLQISQTQGNTPGTLTVNVAPTGLNPGVYTGTISVTSSGASNSPQTINVTLTVTSPALPVVSGFQNAGSYEQSLAVPGSIITIRGTDLGPATGVNGQINGQGFLGTTAGDVEVLFDGIPAPIIYASATQINAVVPYEIYGRVTTRMQVRYRTQRSRELELRVQDSGPGLFTSNASGTGQAAALNQNNSINSPNNPEQRGNVIVLYATGMGQTTPGGTTGRIMVGADLRRPLLPVTVRIGGQNAEVLYAGSAPGLVAGAMQINARIPSNSIIGGNVPVQVQVGNSASQSNVTISVQ